MKRSADSASASYEHNSHNGMIATPGGSTDGSRKKARRDVSDARSMSPLTVTIGGTDDMDEEDDEDESPDPGPEASSSSTNAGAAPQKAKATRGSR